MAYVLYFGIERAENVCSTSVSGRSTDECKMWGALPLSYVFAAPDWDQKMYKYTPLSNSQTCYFSVRHTMKTVSTGKHMRTPELLDHDSNVAARRVAWHRHVSQSEHI